MNRLRGYLTERYAAQNLFNRVSLLLASTRWSCPMPPPPTPCSPCSRPS